MFDPNRAQRRLLSVVAALGLFLSANATFAQEMATPVPTGADATDAAASAPKGPDEHPDKLIIAFQPQENPLNLEPNAKAMAAHLTEALGLPVEVFLPTSYAAVIEALRAGHADVAYFSARPYLLAKTMVPMELVVAEVQGADHGGGTQYTSQYYARATSGIKTLEDAKGKTCAFTSPTSTSGYLFPYAELVKRGFIKTGGDPNEYFTSHIFAGGYEQALRALVAGQVDVAAASDYAFPRFLNEEERAGIVVIAKMGPVPSHVVGVRQAVPVETRRALRTALLDLGSPERHELLKSVYGAEGFREVNEDEHLSMLNEALKLSGQPLYEEQPAPGAAAKATNAVVEQQAQELSAKDVAPDPAKKEGK